MGAFNHSHPTHARVAVLFTLLLWPSAARGQAAATLRGSLPSLLSSSRGAAELFPDATGDDPAQAAAMLQLYAATDGDHWRMHDVSSPASSAAAQQPVGWAWPSRANSNMSYCRWPGILCCSAAVELQNLLSVTPSVASSSSSSRPCQRPRDVLGLLLTSADLAGTLPAALQDLPGLHVLLLGQNPRLTGRWPIALQPPLQVLDVEDTGLWVCQDGAAPALGLAAGPAAGCQLPAAFSWAASRTDTDGLSCPQLLLNASRLSYAAPATEFSVLWSLIWGHDAHDPGPVSCSPGFFHAAGCCCTDSSRQVMLLPAPDAPAGSNSSSSSRWSCGWPEKVPKRLSYIESLLAIVLPGGCLALVLVWFLLRQLRRRLVRRRRWKLARDTTNTTTAAGELTMSAKRSRFPGTPSIALAKGRGVLAVSDVLVTWVVTDVEGSTQLWEWDAAVMGAAVEQHNLVLRGLLDEHGGHEVRTDGDSFTLAFHDAADAVAYCVKAQEQLLEVNWPAKLLLHPYCAAVRLGAACANACPEAAAALAASGRQLEGEGPLILAGLRVRMGINTGVPEDIFVHSLTEAVEYRGEEYHLADDIAGIAAGGQILMGPKTFQRWNRVFSHAAMPTADDDCQQQGNRTSMQFDQDDPAQHQDEQEQQPRRQRSFLKRSIELVGGLLRRPLGGSGGFGSLQQQPSWSAAGDSSMQQVRPRLASLACRDQAESSVRSGVVQTGGDTLLMFSSVGGSKHVGIGHSVEEAQQHAAVKGGVMVSGSNALCRSGGGTTDAAAAPGCVPPGEQLAPGSASPSSPSVAASAAAELPGRAAVPTVSNSFSDRQQQAASGRGRSLWSHVKSSGVGSISFAISTTAASTAARRPGGGSATAAAAAPAAVDSAAGSSRTNSCTSPSQAPEFAAAGIDRDRCPVAPGGGGSGSFSEMLKRKTSLTVVVDGCAAAEVHQQLDRQDSGSPLRHTSLASGKASSPADKASLQLPAPRRISLEWSSNHQPRRSSLSGAAQRASFDKPAPPPTQNQQVLRHSLERSQPQQQPQQQPAAGQPLGEAAEEEQLVAPSRNANSPTDRRQSVHDWQRQLQTEFDSRSSGSPRSPGNASSRGRTQQKLRVQLEQQSTHGVTSVLQGAASFIMRAASATSNLLTGHRPPSASWAADSSSHHGQPTRAGHSSIWGSMLRGASSPRAGFGGNDEASFTSGLSSCQVVLLDLGYFQWRPETPAPATVDLSGVDPAVASALLAEIQAEANAAAAAAGGLLHLVQVQSQRLAPRMLLFDWPLKACEGEDALLQQLLPGFLDAPGASSLCFTSMRELLTSLEAPALAKPDVAIAFVAPEGLKDVLQALGPGVAQACQSVFTSVVREVLLAVGGYESKEVNGQVMASFHGARFAVKWGLALQCALLQAPWPPQLAALQATATIPRADQPDAAAGPHAAAQHLAAPGAAACSQAGSSTAGGSRTSSSSGGSACGSSFFFGPPNVFEGVRARVGIWSGHMDRVLPHGKSGRADYLGPPANRAARMMGAAQGGQVLVEEETMQRVLAEWHELRRLEAGSSCNAQLGQALSATLAAPSAGSGSSHSLLLDHSQASGASCAMNNSRPVAGGDDRLAAVAAAAANCRPAQQQSLLASPRSRTTLFDSVVDSAALFSPAATLLSPRNQRPAGGIRDVDPGSAAAASPAGQPGSLRLELPGAAGGDSRGSQVLTIVPTSYQPRTSGHHVGVEASSLPSSSTGGPLTVAGSMRTSFTLPASRGSFSDDPGYGRSSLDERGWSFSQRKQMFAGTSARARRSLNIGNRVVAAEDLYQAVEAALGAVTPPAASSRRRRSQQHGRHHGQHPPAPAAHTPQLPPSSVLSSALYSSLHTPVSARGNAGASLPASALSTPAATTVASASADDVAPARGASQASGAGPIAASAQPASTGTSAGHSEAFLSKLLPPPAFAAAARQAADCRFSSSSSRQPSSTTTNLSDATRRSTTGSSSDGTTTPTAAWPRPGGLSLDAVAATFPDDDDADNPGPASPGDCVSNFPTAAEMVEQGKVEDSWLAADTGPGPAQGVEGNSNSDDDSSTPRGSLALWLARHAAAAAADAADAADDGGRPASADGRAALEVERRRQQEAEDAEQLQAMLAATAAPLASIVLGSLLARRPQLSIIVDDPAHEGSQQSSPAMPCAPEAGQLDASEAAVAAAGATVQAGSVKAAVPAAKQEGGSSISSSVPQAAQQTPLAGRVSHSPCPSPRRTSRPSVLRNTSFPDSAAADAERADAAVATTAARSPGGLQQQASASSNAAASPKGTLGRLPGAAAAALTAAVSALAGGSAGGNSSSSGGASGYAADVSSATEVGSRSSAGGSSSSSAATETPAAGGDTASPLSPGAGGSSPLMQSLASVRARRLHRQTQSRNARCIAQLQLALSLSSDGSALASPTGRLTGSGPGSSRLESGGGGHSRMASGSGGIRAPWLSGNEGITRSWGEADAVLLAETWRRPGSGSGCGPAAGGARPRGASRSGPGAARTAAQLSTDGASALLPGSPAPEALAGGSSGGDAARASRLGAAAASTGNVAMADLSSFFLPTALARPKVQQAGFTEQAGKLYSSSSSVPTDSVASAAASGALGRPAASAAARDGKIGEPAAAAGLSIWDAGLAALAASVAGDNHGHNSGSNALHSSVAVRRRSMDIAMSAMMEAGLAAGAAAAAAAVGQGGSAPGAGGPIHDGEDAGLAAGGNARLSSDAMKPGVMAECFKIMPAAASGDATESITMIKYTALRQLAAAEDAGFAELLPVAPRLAAAAAAAAASSGSESSSFPGSDAARMSPGKGNISGQFVWVCTAVHVHAYGSFRLKGVDAVVQVVQVLPATLDHRLLHLLPASSCNKGKSRCVAAADGLLATGRARLPDLTQLVKCIPVPALYQQLQLEHQLHLARQQQKQLEQSMQEQQQQHVPPGAEHSSLIPAPAAAAADTAAAGSGVAGSGWSQPGALMTFLPVVSLVCVDKQQLAAGSPDLPAKVADKQSLQPWSQGAGHWLLPSGMASGDADGGVAAAAPSHAFNIMAVHAGALHSSQGGHGHPLHMLRITEGASFDGSSTASSGSGSLASAASYLNSTGRQSVKLWQTSTLYSSGSGASDAAASAAGGEPRRYQSYVGGAAGCSRTSSSDDGGDSSEPLVAPGGSACRREPASLQQQQQLLWNVLPRDGSSCEGSSAALMSCEGVSEGPLVVGGRQLPSTVIDNQLFSASGFSSGSGGGGI